MFHNPQQVTSLRLAMNIGDIAGQSRAVGPESATISLSEAQSEALAEPPSSELKWRRMDPTLGNAVSPLLQKPLVPICKSERARAHKSAVYYSECFLRGITPNDADRAALQVDSQYQKWWVKSAYKEEPRTVPPNAKASTASVISSASSKRKQGGFDSNNEGYFNAPSAAKRRRRRGSLRDVIDDVTFELHNKREPELPGGEPNLQTTILEEELEPRTAVSLQEGAIVENEPAMKPFTIQCIPNLSLVTPEQLEGIRDEILDTLKHNGGVMEDPTIKTGLSILESHYLSSDLDARRADTDSFPHDINGTWLTLSRPTYSECQGKNEDEDYLYSLGRMSFDMFRPTHLQCSIQGTFNTVQMLDAAKGELPYSMPRRIRKELGKSLVEGGVKGLRTYNIIVAFTVQPDAKIGVTRPIRGIMTNYGYLLPDPHVPNRLSVWFTGGSLEVNDDEQDLEEWKRIFGDAPNRDMSEYARLLAAKVLLGAVVPDQMEENGTLNYLLKRPIGGHGSAFCDVLYMDEKLRIMRGHNGSMFAFRKVQMDNR